jgi:flavodoxin
MNTLIAFFSRADENYFGGAYRYIEVGNTEKVALQTKELTDADIFKIEMKTPYAADYNTCIEQAKKDKNVGARPELSTELDSIDEYDTIILMYPNYWGTCPMPVFTFLEKYDFTGKNILPLCTHEGSDMGNSERDIAKYAKGATLKKGLPINGSSVDSAKPKVEKWLKENGVISRGKGCSFAR